MQLPVALQERIEELMGNLPPQEVRAAGSELSQRYRTAEKAPNGERLLRSEAEMRAYCAFRMPATYAALMQAMEMTRASLPEGMEIRTMCDVGSGSGSALWAARQTWPDMERAVLVEREKGMISFAEKLADGLLNGENIWLEGEMQSAELPMSDLVTASFCLGELNEADAEQVLNRLWEHTEKILLVVEPGTPAGFGRIRRYVELLKNRGAKMAAPCPGMDRCPLSTDDWCHFTARVERSRLHRYLKAGELSYEDEKYAFLAVTRTEAFPVSGRIRRHPRIEKGCVELNVCRGDRIETVRVTRKNAEFKAARKADTGSKWD